MPNRGNATPVIIIEETTFGKVESPANKSYKKLQMTRLIQNKLKDFVQAAFPAIELGNHDNLVSILKQNEEVSLLEVLDERGYSLLHEACFHNDERMAKIITRHATETMKAAQVTAFINIKTTGDGFTALHFCSFKGNTTLCQLLIDNGADRYAVNNFGINVVHVAA